MKLTAVNNTALLALVMSAVNANVKADVKANTWLRTRS